MQESNTKSTEQLDSFRPVEGGQETSSGASFLIVAYLLMWAAVLVFVIVTYRHQRALKERVAKLEQALDGKRA